MKITLIICAVVIAVLGAFAIWYCEALRQKHNNFGHRPKMGHVMTWILGVVIAGVVGLLLYFAFYGKPS